MTTIQKREPARNGAEQDVIHARDIYCYTQKSKVCAWWKRNVRRRERRKMKEELHDG